MISVCMVCGSRKEVEPLTKIGETHGFCNPKSGEELSLCASIYERWAERSGGYSLKDYYKEYLAKNI